MIVMSSRSCMNRRKERTDCESMDDRFDSVHSACDSSGGESSVDSTDCEIAGLSRVNSRARYAENEVVSGTPSPSMLGRVLRGSREVATATSSTTRPTQAYQHAHFGSQTYSRSYGTGLRGEHGVKYPSYQHYPLYSSHQPHHPHPPPIHQEHYSNFVSYPRTHAPAPVNYHPTFHYQHCPCPSCVNRALSTAPAQALLSGWFQDPSRIYPPLTSCNGFGFSTSNVSCEVPDPNMYITPVVERHWRDLVRAPTNALSPKHPQVSQTQQHNAQQNRFRQ